VFLHLYPYPCEIFYWSHAKDIFGPYTPPLGICPISGYPGIESHMGGQGVMAQHTGDQGCCPKGGLPPYCGQQPASSPIQPLSLTPEPQTLINQQLEEDKGNKGFSLISLTTLMSTNACSISILNCKGLNIEEKRRTLMELIRKDTYTLLQETHSMQESIQAWREFKRKKYLASHGESNSRGVITLNRTSQHWG
jgi:hypothetical protein